MEAGKERLTRDTVRDATRQEIEYLKRENNDLKQLVADLSLEVHRQQVRSHLSLTASNVPQPRPVPVQALAPLVGAHLRLGL